jgi:hypothetical protein
LVMWMDGIKKKDPAQQFWESYGIWRARLCFTIQLTFVTFLR